MPVLPGAEPFRHEGGEVGVLLCHGFTGSPQSLRPWAEYLAERGLTVSLPLLPGHGTRWEDMRLTGWQDWYAEVDRELRALRERCAQVFVFGLSMGGALALRLAAKHGDAISGLVLVNPANKVHGLAGVRAAGRRATWSRRRRASPSDIAQAGLAGGRVRPGAAARGALAAEVLPAGRRRAAAGDPAVAAAAQPAGPCRAARRTRRGSSAGSRPRTSRRSCWNRATTWRRWTMTRSGSSRRATRSSAVSHRASG